MHLIESNCNGYQVYLFIFFDSSQNLYCNEHKCGAVPKIAVKVLEEIYIFFLKK